jgi:hypothetical protein
MATAAEHDGHPVLGFPRMLASDASTGLPHMRLALPPTSIGAAPTVWWRVNAAWKNPARRRSASRSNRTIWT